MNFVEQDRDYCDKEGQEDEEEEEELMTTTTTATAATTTSNLLFSSPSSSSSSPTKYRNFMLQNQNLWLPSSDNQSQQTSLNFDKRLEFMDLSLGNDNGNVNSRSASGSGSIEREHMFDKVVTPSDVGKLNRLVIPKQHAEKYFPLDSSSNEKGLLLNFEDRNGKPWRFRYSYWNSSQSYVMTKGWSRFVKEKKLDAGDIVSFQRGVGESGKHRLYIDWRRRPNAPDPTSFSHLELQNQLHFPQSVRWDRLYSLPQPLSVPRPYEQSQFHHFNYGVQPYNHQHHHHHHHHPYHNYNQPSQQYYLRPSSAGALQIGERGDPPQMVIDSVPVVHGRSVGKRLRLFGVNVECPTQDDDHQSSSSSDTIPPFVGSFSNHHLVPHQYSRIPSSSTSGGPMPTTEADHEFSKKGKTLSFDLDL